jgi:hypothetical protein
MEDSEFHSMEPPYFHLEEALDWIEFRHIRDDKTDAWQSTINSIKRLERALIEAKLESFGSLDGSPVQAIAPCTWTEFEIHPALSNGQIVSKKGQGDIASFVVRSFKPYRASTLNDLSQPANKSVPGAGQPEPGYYRVLSEVIFLESEIREIFPSSKKAATLENRKLGEYAAVLQQIEGGRFFHSPAPHTPTDVARMVWDHFKKQKKIKSFATVVTGVSRHYRSSKFS